MREFRLMTQADVAAVLRVQLDCYDAVTREDELTIRRRLRSEPDFAWVAEDEIGICAYLVAYRSALGKVTPLGGLFEPQDGADSLYLHDLAVASRAKGAGLGPALVKFACAGAPRHGLGYSSLVSVQGSREFWQRLGYAEWPALSSAQAANLQTYAGPACYMVKQIAP